MINSLSICTWNIGKNVDDYIKHCVHHHPTVKSYEQFIKTYYKTQVAATEILLKEPADVYCLQEVYLNEMYIMHQTDNSDRILITELSKKNFQIIRYSPTSDNVIAINASRFSQINSWSFPIEKVVDYSRKTWDIAIAEAYDTKTKHKMIFASAHVPGFDLSVDEVLKNDTKYGDSVCSKIIKKIDQVSKSRYQFVAADMNDYPEKYSDRFDIFKKANFTLYRTGESTNINPIQKNSKFRELDYFFAREVKPSNDNIFQNGDLVVDKKPKSIFGWDLNINPSDHLPIQMTFKISSC